MSESRRDRDSIAAAIRAAAKFGDILTIADADEPVLAPTVRSAIFEWLIEIRARDELAAVGCAPRRSALLYGPPGTGKTTLAHHLAARLGVPLIAVRSERLVSKYLGDSAKGVADLFQILSDVGDAAVVLFDEIDSIGSKRMDEGSAAAKEKNALLTTILTEVEKFQGLMLAATNRKDAIDAALWRRFGMQIEVALPGPDERYAILCRYLAPFSAATSFMETLTEITAGASPSLLRQLMEGLKRSIVLAPKMRREIAGPAAMIASIVAQIASPPEFTPPPLWETPSLSNRLDGVLWPPILKRSEE